jgi:hypothetical protein
MTKVKEVEEKATTAFSLPNKKVKVIPVIKKTWVPTDHEAAFLFKHATNRFSVPLNSNGHYVDPLTKEEAEYLENHPGLSLKKGDLSPYKKEGNFWRETIGMLKLDKAEKILDLSDPMDYILYKVYLLQKDFIAPSVAESKNKRSYKYAIVDLDFEDNSKSQKGNLIAEAMMKYTSIMNDRSKLIDALFIISRSRVKPDSKLEFLQGQVSDYALNNPQRFLEIMNDKDLTTRVLIEKAVSCKAIERKGGVHRSSGGDLLGTDLQASVEFLNDAANGAVKLLIEEQVKRALSNK